MTMLADDVMKQRQVVTESSFTRTVPFDYVVTVPFGEAGQSTQSLVNISTVGPFAVTGIGYSLLTNEVEAPSRFGTISPGAVGAVQSSAVPQLSPPFVPPVVVKAAAKARRGRPARRAATADPTASATNGFRLFGAPGSQLLITVNGQPLKAGPVQLDANGRAQVDLVELPGLANLVLSDLANGRSSPALVLVRPDQNRFNVTPQFGPLVPQTGSERFDVVASPGSELEATVRQDGGQKIRLQQKLNVPDVNDSGAGIEAGRVQFDLSKTTGRRSNRVLAPGDLLVVRDTSSNLSASFQVPINPLDLSLRALPAAALRRGFRLDRSLLEKYLDNEILPPPEEASAPFVPCGSDPGELSFLYSIIDNGTGRALQSEPIHNIAGLGIADGDRPFRTFPKPFVLSPRSVLLFQVRALSGGPGTLYFVLQGYKVVGGSRRRIPGSE